MCIYMIHSGCIQWIRTVLLVHRDSAAIKYPRPSERYDLKDNTIFWPTQHVYTQTVPHNQKYQSSCDFQLRAICSEGIEGKAVCANALLIRCETRDDARGTMLSSESKEETTNSCLINDDISVSFSRTNRIFAFSFIAFCSRHPVRFGVSPCVSCVLATPNIQTVFRSKRRGR